MTDNPQPRWGRLDYEDWHNSWTVQSMSWKERGLYDQLLKLQFKHGAIPASPKMCGRMLGVGVGGPEYDEFAETFKAVVGQFDPVEGDPSKLQNARQAKERERAVAKIKQKIAAGKASAKSRRHKKKEQPLNERSNARSTDAATKSQLDVDVDLDTDTDIGTNNVNRDCPTADEFDAVESLVELVSDLRVSVGLAPLRGGDEAGRRYIRARLREHNYDLVERVVRYAPSDPWIQESAEIGLGPIFSPKSFPKLLARMESRDRGGGALSAGDKKVIAMRQRIYQQEGA